MLGAATLCYHLETLLYSQAPHFLQQQEHSISSCLDGLVDFCKLQLCKVLQGSYSLCHAADPFMFSSLRSEIQARSPDQRYLEGLSALDDTEVFLPGSQGI